jgi:hypothetical protein
VKPTTRIVGFDEREKRDERGGNQLLSPASGVRDGAVEVVVGFLSLSKLSDAEYRAGGS